jgi:hypothetical protein
VSHQGPLLILACGLLLIIAALLVLILPIHQAPSPSTPQSEAQSPHQNVAKPPPIPTADPGGALLAFRKTAELEPEVTPAQEAVGRIPAEHANQAFRQAMSNTLQALADGRLPEASTALKKAEGLRPGDRAVDDLKQQLARTQLADRLTALRQEAERQEQDENWPAALKSCEEALVLDAHAAFAATCKERASLLVNLDSRLKNLLLKPERLFAEGPLNEARQILAQAAGINPQGAILAAQIDQLDRLITQAEAELEVVIRSDGLTDVTIYHVGRLGLFQEKRLVLRSGDYTATGSRNGFRDVRQTLRIRPVSGETVFTLRCEEPI